MESFVKHFILKSIVFSLYLFYDFDILEMSSQDDYINVILKK